MTPRDPNEVKHDNFAGLNRIEAEDYDALLLDTADMCKARGENQQDPIFWNLHLILMHLQERNQPGP